ncbi:MAG: 2-hydroxychromene-2-carboxylate isomerase [Rhodospirillum sp.]|nr:2-hydroxychromene-2-carboxylate isomerase [Rhodospirillum sp.]MCF8488737.1 2-hydroxychromene-2-carboxylate isomerase [Rhodospirillum sp.]
MSDRVGLRVFFNFRSPYCYLGSKTMFPLFERFDVDLLWRPLPGWQGRSDPERAKVKLPVARQDMRRFARRLGIPVNPPPVTTDPTRAAAISLLAEEKGLLKDWVVECMREEWAKGQDIGQDPPLRAVAERIGLDPAEALTAADDPARLARLESHAEEAKASGVFGVPTFIVGEEIFWGQDRLDFLDEHLRELGCSKL